jgi:ElaB/YqjD/DUF883 family membrane-anchored ribosome-binding protein
MDAPKLKAEWEGFKGYVTMTWDKISDKELVRIEGSLPSLVNLIEEKYKEPREKIEAKLKELFELYLEKKEQLKDDISDIRNDLEARSSRMLRGIRDKSNEYTEAARRRMELLKEENIDPAVEKSEEYIKLHPFTAVLGALGVGVLLGGIFGLLAGKNE